MRWLALALTALALAGTAVPVGRAHAQAAKPALAAPVADAGTGAEAADKLPAEHVPHLSITTKPSSVMTGDLVHLTVTADAALGDDVTLPEQSFAPFELTAKRAHVEQAKGGRQAFVFDLDLLALDPGKHPLAGLELRVVTKDGFVGSTKSAPVELEVKSLLANEPNAQLKPQTKPVVVEQDDFTLLYVLGAILGAALVALLTWLITRYLSRRQRPLPPPPPPRPPWEIAVERLAALRKRKQTMITEGHAAQFVDEVSDVVRAYLGGLFEFDGLETTTDEMLDLLRVRHANAGLWQEVAAYLRRCDLVKFAKVEPDQDECDLVFGKAQDIVQFSMPLGAGYPANAPGGAQQPPPPNAPPPPSQGSAQP